MDDVTRSRSASSHPSARLLPSPSPSPSRSPSPSPSPAPRLPSSHAILLPARASPRPRYASTRPIPSVPLVRPSPARQGQPASQRNFAQSSAGGASSHLGLGLKGRDPLNSAPPEAHAGRKETKVVLSDSQRSKKDRWGESYVPSEETIRNDYSSEYVQTGRRPQNFLRNTAVETRFSEYPKLASLLAQKHALTSSPKHSIPPTYLNLPATLSSPPFDPALSTPSPPSATSVALGTLAPSRFDCILLTPPPHISFSELRALDLGRTAATPGFVWLWVGSGQKTEAGTTDGIGLEMGRQLLAAWGYRRCEDIVWLKTNRKDPEGDLTREPTSLFTPTIEHCLMGIRGTVRRSTDSWFVHCNVDTDVIVWEGDEEDPALKPPELQSLIENFCLGTRRLHLYGSPHSLRRGWLTVGASESTFSSESRVRAVEAEESDAERWEEGKREWTREGWEGVWKKPGTGAAAMVAAEANGGEVTPVNGQEEEDGKVATVKVDSLLPFVEELDALRPKSPPPRNGLPSSGGLGRGRGAGLGITRSGLVSQASVRTPTPGGPAGTPPRSGMGRGRGRGSPASAMGAGGGGAMVPPPPPPPLGMPFPPITHTGFPLAGGPPPPSRAPPPQPFFASSAAQMHMLHPQHLAAAGFLPPAQSQPGFPLGFPASPSYPAQLAQLQQQLGFHAAQLGAQDLAALQHLQLQHQRAQAQAQAQMQLQLQHHHHQQQQQQLHHQQQHLAMQGMLAQFAATGMGGAGTGMGISPSPSHSQPPPQMQLQMIGGGAAGGGGKGGGGGARTGEVDGNGELVYPIGGPSRRVSGAYGVAGAHEDPGAEQ
ncbi:hypothetical protein JCM1841_001059 [Sporobolomyces salmonicolor]